MAVHSAVITFEGVMQKVVSSAPIPEGICLYHGLANVYNVLLVSENENEDEVQRWLDLEKLDKHGAIIYNNPTLAQEEPRDRRLAQVNQLRARGFNVVLCIDPDPDIAAFLLGNGLSVLAFLHRAYALPQWRPDYEETVKPWEKIVAENDRLAILKSQDKRLDKKWD